MIVRAACFALLASLAACSPPTPANTSTATTTPSTDPALPFPTITGESQADILAAACAWSEENYRAPIRAPADTPIAQRNVTGIVFNGRAETMSAFDDTLLASAMGFQQTFRIVGEMEGASDAPPQRLYDLFGAAGTYRIDLLRIAPRHANEDAREVWCPFGNGQGSRAEFGDRDADVCVRVTKVDAAPQTETLEFFNAIPVEVNDDVMLYWTGYRWSGNGGAFIAAPYVERRGMSSTFSGAPEYCPAIAIDAETGAWTHVPAYLDTRAWVDALAPTRPFPAQE